MLSSILHGGAARPCARTEARGDQRLDFLWRTDEEIVKSADYAARTAARPCARERSVQLAHGPPHRRQRSGGTARSNAAPCLRNHSHTPHSVDQRTPANRARARSALASICRTHPPRRASANAAEAVVNRASPPVTLPPPVIWMMTSSSPPPSITSMPGPPMITSSPALPLSVSLPSPPMITSFPSPPLTISPIAAAPR